MSRQTVIAHRNVASPPVRSQTAESRAKRWEPAAWDPSLAGLMAAEDHTVIYEDASLRVAAMSIVPGSVERPGRHRVPSVLVSGFYAVRSLDFLEGLPASDDPDVATLRETSAEFIIGWPDVLEGWIDAPFASSTQRSFVMNKLAIKVRVSIARVSGVDEVREHVRNGVSVPFSALGVNVHETCGDKWLIVHHRAPSAAGRPTS